MRVIRSKNRIVNPCRNSELWTVIQNEQDEQNTGSGDGESLQKHITYLGIKHLVGIQPILQ